MPSIPMVDLKGQYLQLKDEIDAAVLDVMATTQFINGPVVKQFEEQLKQYLDVPHVVPCANGTDALQIALMALGLQPGDEVITAPFTFVATAEVIALLGLKPVFVDVNPCTFTINEFQIEQAISERTKCIIPVHLFGQAANMAYIMDIAERHNLYVVEDNAQAIGADYIYPDGSRAKLGGIGHIGCTSFFPSKNLGAYGDGGAIFTKDAALHAKMRSIANHGSERRYYHDDVGVNSRLDAMQAAVLKVKLPHLDSYNQGRLRAADYYSEQLGGIHGITVPKRARYSTHVFHQYTLLLDKGRDQVMQALLDQGISCAVYYPVPLHLQAAYQHYGYRKGQFPVSEMLADKVLSLPIFPEISTEQQDHVINAIKTAYQHT